jgi:hypothetical protein
MSRRDREHEVSRRALIRWSLAAGAALGVSRSRIGEVLERAAGVRVAEAAMATTTKRSLHVRAGNGGLSWFTQMWPHPDIAANASSSNTLAWFAPGQQQMIAADKTLVGGPATPFATLPANRQVTALLAGHAECHTHNPVSVAKALGTGSLFAIASALQADTPSVVPVISVGDVDVGTAVGAPTASNVPTGADLVGLFDSAASRMGGLLANSDYADIYRAHYATLAGLNRAATRSTTHAAYTTSRSAAHFVGTNLSSQLAVSPSDEAAYGIDANMRAEVAEIGRTLIVTAKAFAMGLTSSVVLPGLRDDPHGAFGDIPGTTSTLAGLKSVFDGFMADLVARQLADDVVITVEGDTPKTPIDFRNWGDGTPGNTNLVYVWGGGALVTGWFGGITKDGVVTGFDPGTGMPAPYDGDAQARAAVAAVAYALTKDMRRVQDFSRDNIMGLIRQGA